MQTVLSNTLSLRPREIQGDNVAYYYEMFPAVKPLTQAREDELTTQALAGCPDSEDALTRQYAGVGISLALQCRWKRSYRGVDVDSLVSAALLGVVQGIRHFDPDRGARLVTCVWWWVMCYVRLERDKHRFVKNSVTFMSDFLVREQEACAADQPLVGAHLEDEEEKDALRRLMVEVLDERELEILNRRYTSCKEDAETLEEIGKSLNVSRQRIGQISDKAKAKLLEAASA